MRLVSTVGDVEEVLGMIEPRGEEALLARRLKAEAIIASLQGSIQDNNFIGDEYDACRELLQLVPFLQDTELIEDVKRLSVQMSKLQRGGREGFKPPMLARSQGGLFHYSLINKITSF